MHIGLKGLFITNINFKSEMVVSMAMYEALPLDQAWPSIDLTQVPSVF